MRRAWPLLLMVMACDSTTLPGESMGSWSFQVTPVEYACGLSDVSDAGFGFTASLSHDRASTQAWMLVGGYVRDAGFDGQYFDTTQDAARIFTQCSVCTTRMVETMRFAVLSQSQWSALGSCVYDGGIPLPDDAGIRAPGPTGQGYDAQHLCGEMTEQVVSDGLADGGACPAECDGCFVRYQLQGTRG